MVVMEDRELTQKVMKLEYILLQMKHELDKTREIVHRMYLKHGSELSNGEVTITDSIEYDIKKNNIGYYVRIMDMEDNSTNKLFCDVVNSFKK
jgi:hypothetical protein